MGVQSGNPFDFEATYTGNRPLKYNHVYHASRSKQCMSPLVDAIHRDMMLLDQCDGYESQALPFVQ